MSGNPAFEHVLGEYRDKVFRLACSVLGNQTAAEDATQETFFKIWRALPYFRGESSVSTWVYSVARNTCLTRRRIAAAQRTVPLDSADAAAIPSKDSSPDAADLRAAIRRLPAKYARVLVLFYLEDRSYQQVALALGLPMGTVKTNLHRAKKELALQLAAAPARRKENALPWPALNL